MRAYEIFREDVTDQIQPNQAVGNGPGKIAQTPGNSSVKPKVPNIKPATPQLAKADDDQGTDPIQGNQPVAGQKKIGRAHV